MRLRDLPERIAASVLAPGEVFQATPDRGGILVFALSVALCLAGSWFFWNSMPGREVLLRAQEATHIKYQARLSPQAYEKMREQAVPVADMVGGEVTRTALRVGIYRVVLSGLLVPILGIVFLRPAVRWLDILSVIGYCSPILVIRELVTTSLSWSHSRPLDAAGIWQLLGMTGGCCGDQANLTYTAAFLTNVDPFSVWWLLVLSVGLAKTYFDDRWRLVGVVLVLVYLGAAALSGYSTMISSNAQASGQPAHIKF